MDIRHENQGIKRVYVRFVNFIKSLIARRAPVAAVELVAIAPTPATAPKHLVTAEPATLAHTYNPGLSHDENMAELDRILGLLDDAATATAGAKTPTNFDIGNPANDQAAPASPGHGAAVCPVASPYPSRTLITHPPIWTRLRANQPSPLTHLLGSPAKPFTLPTATPWSSWSRSSVADKFAQAIRSSQARRGAAVTLNLSPAREKALRLSSDPAGLLATYINRAMKAEIGKVLPFAIQLEISPTGRLHAHGVVCLDRATTAELDALKRALAIAGGKIKGHAGSRQVKVAELYDADGWTAYFSKTLTGTVKALGTDKVRIVSAGLRDHAEADWTAALPRVAKAA